jgi:hypothetical protein
MIRAACRVLAVLALAAPAAHAEWRDGCPAGYDRKDYQRDVRLGAAAESESALTESRVVAGIDPSYHTAHGSVPRNTTYDAFFHVQERPWRGLTLGVTGSYLYHLEGITRTWWPHHYVGSIGWRWDYEGGLPAEEAEKTQGGSLRRGLVLQLIAGGGSSGLADLDGFRRQAALRPFDGYLLGSRVFGSMLEYRMEQVGCHAVFAHLRGGALWTGFGDADVAMSSGAAVEAPAFFLPVTLAVGAYVSANAALIAEYGVAVQHSAGDPGTASAQRLRVAIDYAITADAGALERPIHVASVGFHIDFTSHVYGLVGGFYLEVNDRWIEPRRAR